LRPLLLRPLLLRPLLLLVLAAGAAGEGAAQTPGAPVPGQSSPVPRGPGLGAARDTLLLAPGQRSVRLPPGLVPQSEAVWRLRPDAGAAAAGVLAFLATPLEPGDYAIDYAAGMLTLALPALPGERLVVAYRGLPRFGTAAQPPPPLPPDSAAARARAAPAPASPPGTLRTTGSITRGIVAGSNRDASITSGLRLEVAGEIADGVTVQAALTDENTPILPEGTTQQLSDLDRVFVQIDARRARARLGDVDLALGGSAFAPLARKIQGAAFDAALVPRGPLTGGRVLVAGATTRGLFRSQEIVPIEGVQGPYRLTGARGEPFVLVVPGSERVYLDGARLTRGTDYTLDYATGELAFTPARLVTAERRLTVDFEYTTSRFTRTLAVADAVADFGPAAPAAPGVRARLGVRVLREADGTTFGDERGLTAAELDAIAAAGDRDVLVDGAERVPFDPESPFVLYVRRDTVVAGQTYRVFVPAPPGAEAVFRVRFTRVAPGEGTYRRAGQARNGILYEWTGPAGGGDYIPFRRLPRPTARRLASVRGQAEPLPGLEVFAEWAHSLSDENTLSRLDAADDAGAAAEVGLRLARPLAGGTLAAEAGLRRRSDRFRALDRVRDVDFARRWNLARGALPLVLDTLGEATAEAGVRWQRGGAALALGGGTLALTGYAARRLEAEARLPAGRRAPEALVRVARAE
ncbi:MAG: hypothetical protein ACK41D_12645, partial [Rubricoccaceae bacterium]